MDALAYWGLSPSFSIVQAAFLFCGSDPSNIDWQSEQKKERQPEGYVPVKISLINAVSAGLLQAKILYCIYDGETTNDIDVHNTQIEKRDLDEFFDKGGVPGHFFGRRSNNAIDAGGAGQLPLKLNAALKAWAAVSSDPLLVRGKSPKQALKTWLVEHADELGLRKRDGELNEAGIQEICKVANWRPEGGATPTPAALPAPLAPAPALMEGTSADASDLDDEIPF